MTGIWDEGNVFEGLRILAGDLDLAKSMSFAPPGKEAVKELGNLLKEALALHRGVIQVEGESLNYELSLHRNCIGEGFESCLDPFIPHVQVVE